MALAIVWFRRDLRLADNPALAHAAAEAERLVPVYIHAPEEEGDWQPGSASRWWLHHSLAVLDERLRDLGSRLIVRRGPSLSTLRQLMAETGATAVYWNRLYEPAALARDHAVEQALLSGGVMVQSFNSALLHEPWTVLREGRPYKVFTPFWRAARALGWQDTGTAAPKVLPMPTVTLPSEPLAGLNLLPRIPWDAGLKASWAPGESGALERLQGFVDQALQRYADGRDLPAEVLTSRLSPHLHFGEIGPRQIVQALQEAALQRSEPGLTGGVDKYLDELGWREFSHYLLYHFPHTPNEPLDSRFAAFAWASDYRQELRVWQRGLTGVPIVDAGMRELWRTGWMHNRVRMIAASLLVKNLLIPWQEGARWFWDTLVDADLAANTLGWQWVAGCGADAAPYFRIFNPVLQGEKFDAQGEYVRHWVPELGRLPARWIHKPWLAPPALLEQAGVRLGEHYPRPIVDLAESRRRALSAFAAIKSR